ncbi:MAG: hypothetical protein U5K81_08360 [Trueperaceae bacterium]|nr:hypothetical protein [Trueperaceae bacterium]
MEVEEEKRAKACRPAAAVGDLYSSTLTKWRKHRAAGTLDGLTSARRGPASGSHPNPPPHPKRRGSTARHSKPHDHHRQPPIDNYRRILKEETDSLRVYRLHGSRDAYLETYGVDTFVDFEDMLIV